MTDGLSSFPDNRNMANLSPTVIIFFAFYFRIWTLEFCLPFPIRLLFIQLLYISRKKLYFEIANNHETWIESNLISLNFKSYLSTHRVFRIQEVEGTPFSFTLLICKLSSNRYANANPATSFDPAKGISNLPIPCWELSDIRSIRFARVKRSFQHRILILEQLGIGNHYQNVHLYQ